MRVKNFLLMTCLGSLLLLSACDGNSEEPEAIAEESTDAAVEEKATEEGSSTEEIESDVPEEIADLHLTDVRNDNTGELQKSVTAANVNMPENAMHYYEAHMQDGGVHYVVSFATNTTTMLNAMADVLYVTITEYVDGEEHDASDIGSGMLLKEYIVDLEDGSIEEMENEIE